MTTLNVKDLIDKSPLGKSHLQAFLCCITSLSFDGYDLVVYGSTIPLLLVAWNMSPAQAGFIASYAFAAGVFGAILGGFLGDKWGRKNTIIFSVVLFSVGTFACGLATGVIWFAIARTVTGLGLGMTSPNEMALVSEYFPARYRQTAVSSVGIGMQIGGIMSALTALWLLQPYGWQSVYFFGASIIFAVPLFMRYMPEAPWMLVNKNKNSTIRAMLAKLRPDIHVPEDAIFEYPHAKEKSTLAMVFADNRAFSTIMFWLVYLMNMYMIFGTNTWIPKLMMDTGHELGTSLWLFLSLFLGAGIGSFICGRLADRIGTKRVLIVLYCGAFVFISLLSVRMDAYLTALVMAMVGACTQGAQNVTHSFVTQYFPPTVKSTMLGWGLGLGRFGGLLGPIVGGVLLSMKATLFQSFLALAIPGLIAALAISLVQERHGYTVRLTAVNKETGVSSQ